MRFGRRVAKYAPWQDVYVRCFAWWPRLVRLSTTTKYDTVWVWLEGYARKRQAGENGRLRVWWGWFKVYALEAVVREKVTK